MAGSVCSRCNRQIYAAWRTAKGRYYHPHCFTCAICDCVVQAVTQLDTSNLKEIYCSGCFKQYFSKQDVINDEIENNSSEHNCLDLVDQSEPSYKNLDSCDSSTSQPIQRQHSILIQNQSNSQALTTTDDDSDPTTTQCSSENESAEIPSSSPEAIKNIIEQVDSISERRKRSVSLSSGTTGRTPLKREGSMVPQSFASRIPRFQSSPKLPAPLAPSIKSCSLITNSTKASAPVIDDAKVKKSPFLAPLKLHSTKINEYLSRKVMKLNHVPKFPFKPSIPMKATPLASELTSNRNIKKSLTRSPTFFKTSSSGSDINVRRSETTTDASLQQPQKKLIPASSHKCHPPPLPVTSKDFSLPRKQSSMILKLPGSSSTTKIKDSENPKTNSIKTKTSSCSIPLPTCQQLLSVMLKPQKGWPSSSTIPSMEDDENISPLLSTSVEKRPETSRWNENLSCPICFEPLIEGKRSGRFSENIVTGCGHIFHRDCIKSWLGKKGNNRCPICSKFCLKESIIAVYLEANVVSDLHAKTNETEGLSTMLSTLREDYQHLNTEFQALSERNKEYELKSAVTDSLRSAYEVECRNKVELQCENKRLQRKVEELRTMIQVAQGDTIP